MMAVYIILGVIVIGSFISGVVLILKDNRAAKSNNDILYDDPKDLFDDSNEVNKVEENLGNVDTTVETKTNEVLPDELFDDEII